MRCHFCGADPDAVACVPHPQERRDVLACIPCSINAGVYCQKHDVRHIGFVDGGHACLRCIEETVQELAPSASCLLMPILTGLDQEEQERIRDWGESVRHVLAPESPLVTLLRSVVSAAYRKKTTPHAIVQEVVAAGTVDDILPAPF